ncbi:enterochelin esterase-like enzyme [Bacillus niacini]|jgi:enterochelin esterase-like enzyme|uniref:Enterochelin esterase-like enzyme n=1 Tax=Neobacillus niacini TaxID=86668 RepID=A0A852T9J7_9BACI|nr:alpha/beta hydrolase-fold protein [Neobacillus niacini]NYE05472.1 enterochelin esterase-like enzyme [Neobacillus niacini]
MEIPKGTIKEHTIKSNELGEDILILIYLPANFSPLYKYSLLIAQDGRDYFQLGKIGRLADEYLFNREIENLIIVGIPYNNVGDRRSKYHPDGEQQQQYIRFLAHELVPFLDQEYPTYHMGSTRALIGDSLGATVSLMTALQYPHSFGKVLLQSPYINQKVLDMVNSFTETELLEIYHIVGNQETKVQTTNGKVSDFLSPNRKLSTIFTDKSFTYFYDEFNGDHTWTYWQPDLKRALKMMF